MRRLNDLNSILGIGGLTLSRSIAKEITLEPRSNRVCPTHQLCFAQRIQSLRDALRWQQESAFVLLLGSVSHYGFRPTDVSRKLTRHRSLSRCAAPQALSLRLQWTNQAFHPGRRQRETRLAHLPRLRAESDSNSTSTLRSFRLRTGVGSHRLCLRRHDYRSLSVALSLGQIQAAQSGNQTTYPAGNSQRYACLYCHYQRRCPRSKPARRTPPRAWFFHCHGSRLRRFPASLPTTYGTRFLRHSHQRQSGFSPSLFSSARPRYRRAQRSNHHPHWSENSEPLSDRSAPRSLLFSRKRAALGSVDQQLFDSGINC